MYGQKLWYLWWDFNKTNVKLLDDLLKVKQLLWPGELTKLSENGHIRPFLQPPQARNHQAVIEWIDAEIREVVWHYHGHGQSIAPHKTYPPTIRTEHSLDFDNIISIVEAIHVSNEDSGVKGGDSPSCSSAFWNVYDIRVLKNVVSIRVLCVVPILVWRKELL